MTSNEALTPAMIEAGKRTMRTLCLSDEALWGDALIRIWQAMNYAADTPVCASTEEACDHEWATPRFGAEDERECRKCGITAEEVTRAEETIERLRAWDGLYTAAANLRQAQRDYMEVRNGPRDVREEFGRAVAEAADKLDDALAAISSIPEPLIMPLEGSK